jgi:energy-coupling factor transport system ATP-binding protein
MKIEISDLHFAYPSGPQVLRGISLTIDAGEQVAIVGQNGAGKTTLVRHFNGLLRPARGSVRIGDWDAAGVSVAKLAARVGYVFQNPDEQLFSRDVGAEVRFGPRNLGYAKDKVDRLVSRALALTELGGMTEVNPYDLSPAWRKMVALASVIAMNTPIVILDEPTTGQDSATLGRLACVIAELRRAGRTVIAITHDIDFCAENFERVIALSNGRVLIDGPAAEVFSREALLAQTFVEPPQLARLGSRLGFGETVIDQEGFLNQYALSRGRAGPPV